MFKIAIRSLKYLLYCPSRQISTKYDSNLILNLTKRLNEEKILQNIDVDNYKELFEDNIDMKNEICKIIEIYDNMKYNLEDVPTTIKQNDLLKLVQLESFQDIKRFIRKLYRKELDVLLKNELKKYEANNNNESQLNHNTKRTGIFDSSGNIIYGLWHNTLFNRFNNTSRTRFSLDRLRNVELFGQNLYIDMSFSKYLSYNVSLFVANDIGNLLNFNRYKTGEPFKVILCGVCYEENVWKILVQNFPLLIDSTIHTEKSYLDLFPDRTKIVYITCMENKRVLEYNPDYHYVMAAVSEKDIQNDFLTPQLNKMNIQQQGIPIDQYLLWNVGSKRLNLLIKMKILNDLRDNNDWKQVLLNNINPRKIKTEKQILSEDRLRHLKLLKNTKKYR